MKTTIVAINSKYIHSALAPWYLKYSCGGECGQVLVKEFTINDSADTILADIYRTNPDVVAFGCYIWNISLVLELAANLKKVLPETGILLGGPEVSFDGIGIMNGNPSVDYILAGEAEVSFKRLLLHLSRKAFALKDIPGLTHREGEAVVSDGSYPLVEDLDSIPSPYTGEMLSKLENRIVYYEASRGCPFSCAYCLSSTFDGVRRFSLERVKADLLKLVGAGVRQIKFVDRTFNAGRQRTKEIFAFIISMAGGLKGQVPNFHFEVAADLFDDEMIEILSGAPEGLIQFEIGVQSTHGPTLDAIERKTDLDRLFRYSGKLRDLGSIHLHMDLIAGLPGEDFHTFRCSFNQVYRQRPHQLQLGFLKMLKGSKIRREADTYGYSFKAQPPYEILKNRYLSFEQVLELKGVEEMLERYYNSARFVKTLEFIHTKIYDEPFDFYLKLYKYYSGKGYLGQKFSARQCYSVLMDFLTGNCVQKDLALAGELLKLDFLSSDNSNNLPEGLSRNIRPGFKERCFEFLKTEGNVERYLPEFIGLPAKQVIKQVHFEAFSFDLTESCEQITKAERVILFNYAGKNRVTGLYPYTAVEGF